jgi:hypothetical protein
MKTLLKVLAIWGTLLAIGSVKPAQAVQPVILWGLNPSGQYVPLPTDTNGYLYVSAVSGGGSSTGTFTDKSSSITTGGTAKTLTTTNANRRNLTIQNTSSGDEWISWTTSTWVSLSATGGWYKIAPGGSYETPSSAVTSQAFTIWGATTGQTYSASEM